MNGPIFVRIDDYKDVLDIISIIRKKIDEAKSVLDKINDLKSKEDNIIEKWQENIDEVERKVDIIDKSLFAELK